LKISARANKRIGSRLLKKCLEDSIRKGVIEAEVSTADPNARRFYEKHGFKQFQGQSCMGEMFLELNTSQHKN
jgi:N-acetylglutamate synthase-like GNAT family acetyltransferase